MLRILLTGVTGQVGSELFITLQNLGEVIPTIGPGETFFRPAVTLDLASADSIATVVDTVKPDLIVNPAAYTAVDKAEDEWEIAFKVNGLAPSILADIAKKNNIGLIHFSTDYVYKGEGSTPYKEDAPTGPLNNYGKSKLAGDNAIEAVDGASLILRTSWVYSPTGNNFVKTMLRLGKDIPFLRIINDQFGAPTYSRTLADITAMIIAKANGNIFEYLSSRRGVYHVANSGETTWYDFANKIFELAFKYGYKGVIKEIAPVSTKDYPTSAIRPHNSRLCCDKLYEHFGIKPVMWDIALEWAISRML
jgi:dTDP-4-dehydrorhamnose reductase